jgi:hypothetical protein
MRNKLLLAFALGAAAALLLLAFDIWKTPSSNHSGLATAIQHDTRGTVRVTGFAQRQGVSIVKLSTPHGPEIGYLIHHRYLALGPLMDLKSGRNVTPTWEKILDAKP